MNANAIQNLTLGEIAAVESMSGLPITSLAGGDAPIGKLMAALVYVIKKRADKGFKFEDALNLTTEEANEVLGIDLSNPTA